jgi:TadE-like protein
VARHLEEGGQTELVIVFPAAMLLILLVLQGVLWFVARSIAADAAQDGARSAAVVDGTAASGASVARSDLEQLAGPMLSTTQVSALKTPSHAQVTVTGKAESILPGFSLSVGATAIEPTEMFRP